MFWLAEDGKLDNKQNPLANYALNDLLDNAWIFDVYVSLSDEQVSKIITGIQNETVRSEYLEERKRLTNAAIQRLIVIDYKRKKNLFSKETPKLIKSMMTQKDPRWGNFDVATERLNAVVYTDFMHFVFLKWMARNMSWTMDNLWAPAFIPTFLRRRNTNRKNRNGRN